MDNEIMNLLKRVMPSSSFKPVGGRNVMTKCPFHKGGQEAKASFSINLGNGMFHCFTGGCPAGSGSIIRLLELLRMPTNFIELEKKSLSTILEKNRKEYELTKAATFVSGNPFEAKQKLPEPLLGVYDWVPSQLVDVGFEADLLKLLQVGFDQNQQRITYPIRDMYGNLAGISGGSVIGQEPKYKVYQGKRQVIVNGKTASIKGDFGDWFDEQFPGYTCENHNYLWNFHRIYNDLLAMSHQDGRLYVCEGFKATMWMIQNGYWNTVALMGSAISERQQQHIHRLGLTVYLCLDNDRPGRIGMLRVGNSLWNPMQGKIKVMRYPAEHDRTQPDGYNRPQLMEAVENSYTFAQFVDKQMTRGEY